MWWKFDIRQLKQSKISFSGGCKFCDKGLLKYVNNPLGLFTGNENGNI